MRRLYHLEIKLYLEIITCSVWFIRLCRSSKLCISIAEVIAFQVQVRLYCRLNCGKMFVKLYLLSHVLLGCCKQTVTLSVKVKGKGKGFPYSTQSVGPGADPGVQAVSPQVTVSHTPGGRLPLLSARPPVTSPAAEHHHPLAGSKLHCLETEAHKCKQLA